MSHVPADHLSPEPLLARAVEASAVIAREADRRAAALDQDGAFPAEDVARLAELGLLEAALPRRLGGAGLGEPPGGARALMEVLRRIGHGSLPLGRLYEGHVNALRLVELYGTERQRELFAREVRDGALFGVWNTDGSEGLALHERPDGRTYLEGGKILASGAGQVERPLVTAKCADGTVRMVLPRLIKGERADLSRWVMHGMRASATGSIDLSGLRIEADDLLGGPGDYLREPVFSGGAWRFATVQLGGIERLLDELRLHLTRTNRGGDPYQQARVGTAAMAAETARLWVAAAAALNESPPDDPGEVIAYVNLARSAVERAGLDVLELTHRSIGLAGFHRDHPVERVTRDLATYLRQPAPDRALARAAAHVLAVPAPIADLWSRA